MTLWVPIKSVNMRLNIFRSFSSKLIKIKIDYHNNLFVFFIACCMNIVLIYLGWSYKMYEAFISKEK